MAELIKISKVLNVIFTVCIAFAYIALIGRQIILAIAFAGIDLGIFVFLLGFYIEVQIEQALNQKKSEKNLY